MRKKLKLRHVTRELGARAFVLAGVCAAAACGQIIGADFDQLEPLEDASVGSGGGSQGTGGVAGSSGGAVGQGGSSGSAATGGGGSSGGIGGSGGGGTGGSGAAGGAAGGGGGSGGSDGMGGGGTGGSSGGSGGSSGGSGGSAGSDGGPIGVMINEVDGGLDYIEIYNASASAIDVSDYKICDAEGTAQGPKLSEAAILPPGTVLEPGGFLIVLGNQAPPAGGPFTCLSFFPCFHVIYGVSSSGERVYLLRPDNAEIDSVDWPAGIPNGQSLGRLPDGTGSFSVNRQTPGAANQAP